MKKNFKLGVIGAGFMANAIINGVLNSGVLLPEQIIVSDINDTSLEKLRSKGHLFLNEVYDSLGIPRSREGQAVGWVYDKKKDTYVDFGIYNINRASNREFVNGYERSILLDFNVDGDILNLI